MTKTPMDRFHICEVYYHYLSRNYYGQGCPLYARLSKLLSYYRPSMLASWDNADPDVRADVLALEEKYVGRTKSRAGGDDD